MVPWPHMAREPVLLKKITPAALAGSTGGQSSAPTMTSLPRGSSTVAARQASCWPPTRRPPGVMRAGQQRAALGHAGAAQIRKAVEHQPRGFAAGVGVEHPYASHEMPGCNMSIAAQRHGQAVPEDLHRGRRLFKVALVVVGI